MTAPATQPPVPPVQPPEEPPSAEGQSASERPGHQASVHEPSAHEPSAQVVSLWNIANILTVARLALVPVFTVLLVHAGGRESWWRLAAALVFMVASFTDRLDGQLARERGLITDFGKLADPIADKALMGAALISLSALGELWWWVTVVIMVRELGITLLRFWVINYGVIAASRGGKLKTLLQGLAIWLYVLPLAAVPGLAWLTWVSDVIMGAALVVTVVTGVDYVIEAVRLRRSAGPARRAAEQADQTDQTDRVVG